MPSIPPLEGRPALCQAKISSPHADDGVDDVMELAKFAGGVEVGEPVESFEGAIVVIGQVETVELLEGISAGSQPWVGVEELGEAGLVVFVEVVGSL